MECVNGAKPSENLTFPQFAMNFSAFYGTQMFAPCSQKPPACPSPKPDKYIQLRSLIFKIYFLI